MSIRHLPVTWCSYSVFSKDVADRIVTNRPYRVKGELVAKNVVPKETFDLIKERISVSP